MLKSETRVSHFIPRPPLGRARHALPHSHGRPMERGPRAPTELEGCGRLVRGSNPFAGAAPATSSCHPGAHSDPALTSRAACGITFPGQRCSVEAAASGRGGGWGGGIGLGASAGLRSAPRRALRCFGLRGGGAGGSGSWKNRGPEPRGEAAPPGPVAVAEPRPARELRGPPRTARAPPPSPLSPSASLLAWAHLAGGRRALGSYTASSRRPRPGSSARRRAQAGRSGLRAEPCLLQRVIADLGCVGRRKCLKRLVSPQPPPPSSPSSSEGYLHSPRLAPRLAPRGALGSLMAVGVQECKRAVSGGEGRLGAWHYGSESLCTSLEHTPFCRAEGRATCAPGSALQPAGWGVGERSILPGPLVPFVPPARPSPALPPGTSSQQLPRGARGA